MLAREMIGDEIANKHGLEYALNFDGLGAFSNPHSDPRHLAEDQTQRIMKIVSQAKAISRFDGDISVKLRGIPCRLLFKPTR
jgi:hypothetical protein